MARPFPEKAKRRRLAREYLKDLNGPRAVKAAGFNPTTRGSAAARASQLLKEPEVAAEIEALEKKTLEKLEIDVEAIVRELRDVAMAPNVEIKDAAKVKAAELILKRFGLLNNKVELSGPNGRPIEVQRVKMGDEEIEF